MRQSWPTLPLQDEKHGRRLFVVEPSIAERVQKSCFESSTRTSPSRHDANLTWPNERPVSCGFQDRSAFASAGECDTSRSSEAHSLAIPSPPEHYFEVGSCFLGNSDVPKFLVVAFPALPALFRPLTKNS